MAANRTNARRASAADPFSSWTQDLEFSAKTKEKPDERKHRLQMERWKTMLDLTRHSILYIAALVLACIVGAVCVNIVLNAAATPDDRKWATAILTSITTALVGFLVGQGLTGAK